MIKWVIKDWANNILFNGKTFNHFDDAWCHIYTHDPILAEQDEVGWYDDYYVDQID